MLIDLGMNEATAAVAVPAPAPAAPTAPAARAVPAVPAATTQAQVRANVNPFKISRAAPIPALQGQGRALLNPFDPRQAIQGQARALVNPSGPLPPQGLCVILRELSTNKKYARGHANRSAGRQTQDSISNPHGRSLVVHNRSYDPILASATSLFQGHEPYQGPATRRAMSR